MTARSQGPSIERIEETEPNSTEQGTGTSPIAAEGVPSLEAAVARERARAALFGAAAPTEVGRFRILDRLGQGAMGVVYRAHDPKLDRRVAIKVVTPDEAMTTRQREAVLVEARGLAQLSHPNVVSVYEVGTLPRDAGPPHLYIAMELVEGRTLRAWMSESSRPWTEVVGVFIQAARGLHAVHEAGLVHGDIKPDNLMLGDDGRVRVMDFGLVRADDTSDSAPQLRDSAEPVGPTRVGGTPAYMSPEHIGDRIINARGDQWALCVSMYEALWGRRPFEGETRLALFSAVVQAEVAPRPPQMADDPVPRRIAAIVRRGLCPDPDSRWSSVGALADALKPPPYGRWRLPLFAGGTAVAVGALWIGRPPVPLTTCDDPSAAFEMAWSPVRRGAVREAFLGSGARLAEGHADTVVASLDAYAAAWVEAVGQTCQAQRGTTDGDRSGLDLQMACLRRQRRDATALVDALVLVNAERVGQAPHVVDALPRPVRCSTPATGGTDRVPPRDPAVADAVERLSLRLSQLDARMQLGDIQPLDAVARPLLAEIDGLGYAPLLRRAHLFVGELQMERGQLEVARDFLERSYFAAHAVDDVEVAADAAVTLVSLLTTYRGDFDAAERWLRVGEAVVSAAGTDRKSVALANLRIDLLQRRGQHDAAIADGEALLRRVEAACDGGRCEARPEIHGTLSVLYAEMGRLREALDHAERRRTLEAQFHPPLHPHRADAVAALGMRLFDADRPRAAEPILGRALAAYREVYGEHDLRTVRTGALLALVLSERVETEPALGDDAFGLVASIPATAVADRNPIEGATLLATIASVYGNLGEHARARDGNVAAAEAMAQAHPEGHPTLAIILSNAALESYAMGDYAPALEGFERSLQMRRRFATGQDKQQAVFLVNIASCLLKLGRGAEAEPRYLEVLSLTEGEPVTAPVIKAYLELPALVGGHDPTAAAAIAEQGARRCQDAPAEVRDSARCRKIIAGGPR